MLRALLVDDEPRANERMRSLLADHPQIEVAGVAGTLAEARSFLEKAPPNVVFLDVEMPGGSGLDLLVSVPDGTHVVFVTASETYAVAAFAAEALDYLVKPVNRDRLAETVGRIRRRAVAMQAQLNDDSEPGCSPVEAVVRLDDVVSVPLAGRPTSSVVRVRDICWIEALRNHTRVSLKSPAGVRLFSRRLSHWDKILPANSFARVGRSYILQLAAVEQVEWSSRRETVVTFGAGVEPLSLGRLPTMRLREILGGPG